MIARVLILCCAAGPWAFGQTPCVAVTDAQILGADLARAVPAFKAVPPGLPIAPSPLPGASRIFPVSELETLASRFAIRGASLSDICFRIATEPVDRARLVQSMSDALGIPGVRIEVIEMSHETLPVGRVDFQRQNLGTPASPWAGQPVIWRGDIVYAGDRRFSIWARVKVMAPLTRVIAAESLRAGVPLKPGQAREEVTEGFPLLSRQPASLSQIEGRIPVRAIAAGAEVRPDDVKRPNEVDRGDLVHVEVRIGAARLALTGRAESGGILGDMVPVRNLDSSRIFQARIEGKDSVIVQLGGAEVSLK
jgi:flagella basal body P-ring formation protein FlgA